MTILLYFIICEYPGANVSETGWEKKLLTSFFSSRESRCSRTLFNIPDFYTNIININFQSLNMAGNDFSR